MAAWYPDQAEWASGAHAGKRNLRDFLAICQQDGPKNHKARKVMRRLSHSSVQERSLGTLWLPRSVLQKHDRCLIIIKPKHFTRLHAGRNERGKRGAGGAMAACAKGSLKSVMYFSLAC